MVGLVGGQVNRSGSVNIVVSNVGAPTPRATLAWRQTVREWCRPWKLITLLLGVALLIWGSFAIPAPDWDIPISIIMALMTYATASWSLRVVMLRAWRWLPLALLYTWWSVDGCYALYWWWQDPHVLALMRDVNFPASLALYGICAVLWLYQGSLREIVQQLRCAASAGKYVDRK
jgi:hypothetical protein